MPPSEPASPELDAAQPSRSPMTVQSLLGTVARMAFM